MKKLLVLALAMVLTFSLAVAASAATLDPYVGGRITWSYVDSDARENMPSGVYNSGIKLLLKGTVKDEETGSWGTIGAKLDAWPLNGYYEDPVKHNDKGLAVSGIYEFGINGVGGSNFNIWYTNFENEKGNQGMDRMWGIDPLQTHTDCMFDRDLTDNVLGIDYVTDTVEVNFAYGLNTYDKDKDNEMSIAATFKFDGGDIHVGHYNDKDGFSEINVGGSYKLGFGTIKADYLNASVDTPGAEDASIIQVGASVDAINFEAMVGMDDGYQFAEGGLLYDLKFKPIDNVTLCYRAAQADEEADEENNYTNFYVGYKYGVIEARLGTYTKAADTPSEEEGVYASCYVSFW
ncbi:MAG: hypothetical protein GX075_10265 [Firmicutes bacterium]|nr:hypothetical protein [Bacillota bacterium]